MNRDFVVMEGFEQKVLTDLADISQGIADLGLLVAEKCGSDRITALREAVDIMSPLAPNVEIPPENPDPLGTLREIAASAMSNLERAD